MARPRELASGPRRGVVRHELGEAPRRAVSYARRVRRRSEITLPAAMHESAKAIRPAESLPVNGVVPPVEPPPLGATVDPVVPTVVVEMVDPVEP